MHYAQFDLSHIRCFIAVAEELHFGRAAARLNMTQPPLSRQIQVLERVLDVALLERNSRIVKLTPAGRSFLPEAQRILRQADIAVAVAKRAGSGAMGSLRLGFTAATAYSYLPSLIMACQRDLPEIDLVLMEAVTRDQIEGLLSQQLDIGLLRPPIMRSELNAVRVMAEPMVAAVPEHHPLAGADAIRPIDLHDEAFIMYATDQARYFHDLVLSMLQADGVLPRFVQHLAQIHSILALVHAGAGVAVVPASASALHYERVVFKPIQVKRPRPAELYLVWRKEGGDRLVEPVVELAQSLFHQFESEPG